MPQRSTLTLPPSQVRSVLLTALWVIVPATSGLTACLQPPEAPCEEGAAGCACASPPAGPCDAGLVCVAGTCALAPPDGAESDAPTGDAATGDVEGPGSADGLSGEDVGPVHCPEPPFAAGCACGDDSLCGSGLCGVDAFGGRSCAPSCDAGECQGGLFCVPGVPGAAGHCVAAEGVLCRPCETDADCAFGTSPSASRGRCVDHGPDNGRFCGVPCDGACPEGYACGEVSVGPGGEQAALCTLADPSATCGCSARSVADEAATPCTLGECSGSRTCTAEGLSACTDDTGEACPAPVTVSYDAAPGVLAGERSRTVWLGLPYEAHPEASRAGYRLASWRTERNGAGDDVTAETVVSVSEPHELFAAWSALSYRVSFDSATGSACVPVTVTFGAPYGTLCAPERPGYAFSGWYLGRGDAAALVTADDTVSTASDHELTARWTPRELTVRFDAASGRPCTPESITVTFDAAYGALCATDRYGYIFSGWFDDASDSGQRVTAQTLVQRTTDHTVYARWEPKPVSVSFDPQGGTQPDPASIEPFFGAPYGALPSVERSGHDFAGWWTTSTVGGVRVDALTQVERAEPHALFARWTARTYMVQLDSAGGSACDPLSVTFGAPYGLTCVPTRPGYAFLGWYNEPSGGERVGAGSSVSFPADHTLYARWSANRYALTMDAMGGSGCPTSLQLTFDAPYGSLCEPSRTGYVFGGWWSASAGGFRITPDVAVNTPGAHTVWARWTAGVWRVGFLNADGTQCPDVLAVYDLPYNLPCTPERTGHTFTGWTLDGVLVTAATVMQTPRDHDLRANWSADSFLLSFDSEGGTACPPRAVIFGARYGELCVPARTGYAFAGWFDGDGGAGNAITEATMVGTASNHSLHARWRANLVPVSFDAQGGTSPSPASREVSFGASYRELATTSRVGYAFAGWWTGTGGTGSRTTEDTHVTEAAPHTLFAHWAANAYAVTFDSEGGTPCQDLQVRFAAPYAQQVGGVLCSPTRVGWTFGGWFAGEGGTGERILPATIVSTASNHALHAHWTANSYAVSLDSEDGTPCEAVVVTYGQPYGPLCTPSRPGYAFMGWWTGDNGTGARAERETIVSTPSIHTLYAAWFANVYTVRFDASSGPDASPREKEIAFDDAYGDLPDLSRVGYAFGGWWTEPSGGSQVNPGTLMTRDADHVLFARWVANGHQVTFDNRGGSGCASLAVTYGQTYGASGPLCTPTRRGYVFSGWRLGGAGGEPIAATTVVETNSPHALFADWTPMLVGVTFDLASGVATAPDCSPITLSFDSPYGSLCAPDRAGYTFEGWYLRDDRVTPQTLVTSPTSHELMARWTAEVYSLTFDAGEGTEPVPPSRLVTFGASYGELATSSRVGYALAGWSGPNGELVTTTSSVMTQGAHVLDAVWVPNRYSVTFETAGAAPCEPSSVAVTYDAAYGQLCQPVRAGHTFLGWSRSAGGAGEFVTPTTLVTTAEAHDLHAAWTTNKYTITWDGAPGACPDGATAPTREIAFGSPYGTPTCALSRPGHTLVGWSSTPSGSGGTTIEAATLMGRAADHSVFAIWLPETRTVSFDSRRGSPCPSRPATFGQTYGALCVPTRAGYTFEGWETSAGRPVDHASTVETVGDHTLGARWTSKLPGYQRLDAGTFVMGSPVEEAGRETHEAQAEVVLTRPLWVAEREVTQGAWRALAGQNPAYHKSCGDTCPVEMVSWWSALAYANARSEAEGLPPCYLMPSRQAEGILPCTGAWQAGTLDCGDQLPAIHGGSLVACPGYRLPTEAEWEYAARAGTSGATYGGDLVDATSTCPTLEGDGAFTHGTSLGALAWFGCNNGTLGASNHGPKPGGTRAANAWDLFDLLGNVAEWTSGRYDPTNPNTIGGTDPTGPVQGSLRVRRGGSYGSTSNRIRAASREALSPSVTSQSMGLRLVRTAEDLEGFVRVPAGSFTAGSPTAELGRQTHEAQVQVTLTRDVWLGQAEVTRAEWKALSGGSDPSSAGVCDSCPVENLTWWSMLGYLNARSVADNLPPCHVIPTTRPDGSPCTGAWQTGDLDCGDALYLTPGADIHACAGYRLPTEAEWERAARAGTGTATYAGDLREAPETTLCFSLSGAGAFANETPLKSIARYACEGQAGPVRMKLPNGWGLHDTLGSVWELTTEYFDVNSAAAGTNPQRTGQNLSRVRRGGSTYASGEWARAASRASFLTSERNPTVGFRAARTVAP